MTTATLLENIKNYKNLQAELRPLLDVIMEVAKNEGREAIKEQDFSKINELTSQMTVLEKTIMAQTKDRVKCVSYQGSYILKKVGFHSFIVLKANPEAENSVVKFIMNLTSDVDGATKFASREEAESHLGSINFRVFQELTK